MSNEMPLKKVVSWSYVGACRYTGYRDKTIRLVLECGHENYRKASQGAPKRARCRECWHYRKEVMQ